jgi:malonate transporter and related proteins
VLIGFAIIAAVVVVGVVVGRIGVLGEQGRLVLGRFAFFVASPCLLLTTLAEADVATLFSGILVVSVLSALAVAAVYLVLALTVLRLRGPVAVIATMSSAYVNAANIGIPVAAYVLGDPALSAPVILFQVVIVTPIVLTLLDVLERGRVSVRRVLTSVVRNPIVLGSFVGLAIGVLDLPVPDAVLEPIRLVGAAAVPVVLISFGMAIGDQRPLAAGSGRAAILTASLLKLLLMPVVAWLLGDLVFALAPRELFVVVALAALPTAQNVFNYAQRYGRGEVIARDVVLITTVSSLPVLMLVAALLAPF